MDVWAAVGALGWVLLLVGFLMSRAALNRLQLSVNNRVNGNNNQITNSVHQSMTPTTQPGGSDALATWSGWASIVGLALTLWPLVEGWLLLTS